MFKVNFELFLSLCSFSIFWISFSMHWKVFKEFTLDIFRSMLLKILVAGLTLYGKSGWVCAKVFLKAASHIIVFQVLVSHDRTGNFSVILEQFWAYSRWRFWNFVFLILSFIYCLSWSSFCSKSRKFLSFILIHFVFMKKRLWLQIHRLVNLFQLSLIFKDAHDFVKLLIEIIKAIVIHFSLISLRFFHIINLIYNFILICDEFFQFCFDFILLVIINIITSKWFDTHIWWFWFLLIN